MQESWPHALQQLVGSFKIFFRFTGESDNHVDAEKDTRATLLRFFEDVADQGDLLFKLGCRVAPMHRLQRAVAARLDGDVEVRQEFRASCNPAQDLLGEQVRFNGGDAVALDARHVVQRLEQIKEGFAGRLAEITGVDAGQHNFDDALCGNLARLRHDGRDGDVAAPRA